MLFSQLDYVSIQAGQWATRLVILFLNFHSGFSNASTMNLVSIATISDPPEECFWWGTTWETLALDCFCTTWDTFSKAFFLFLMSTVQAIKKRFGLTPIDFKSPAVYNRDQINLKDHCSCEHIKEKLLNLRRIKLALHRRTFVNPGCILVNADSWSYCAWLIGACYYKEKKGLSLFSFFKMQ